MTPLMDPAAVPITQLLDKRECDLRARTLTTLLAALLPNGDLESLTERFQRTPNWTTAATGEVFSDPDLIPILKLLNSVARLLVREQEIVAVLPKRSGRDARLTLFFACDSGSEPESKPGADEDITSQINTTTSEDASHSRISGDPRQAKSPPPSKRPIGAPDPRLSGSQKEDADPIGALAKVSTMAHMAQYLYEYPQILFDTHVASVEYLLNAIVEANEAVESNLYWEQNAKEDRAQEKNEPDDPEDEPNTEKNRKSLVECLILRTRLLTQYIASRSVGKMRRHFRSPQYKIFLEVMKSITIEDITPSSQGLTDIEHSYLQKILSQMGIGSQRFPSLSNPIAQSNPIDTAWDLHRLFILSMELAQQAVEHLYQLMQIHTQEQSSKVTLEQFTSGLGAARFYMDTLHTLVRYCPCIQAHIRGLEHTISTRISLDPQKAAVLLPFDQNFLPDIEPEVDTDGEMTDTLLEMSNTQTESRIGQQIAWLLVSSQESIDSITESSMLPTRPMKFTTWDPETLRETDGSGLGLHDWRNVVFGMYPEPSKTQPRTSTQYPSDSDTIYGDEAIQALSEFADTNPGKWADIFTTRAYKFRGCSHTEALLATMRFPEEQRTISSPPPLHIFRDTYPCIGVSKPCCPVCTKLLSLLQPKPPYTQTLFHLGYIPPSILSSHNYIYPTALPPYLPSRIAQELLLWLESLLRIAIERIVIERRKRSRESLGDSIYGDRSGDSKGDSPGKDRTKPHRRKGKGMDVSLLYKLHVLKK